MELVIINATLYILALGIYYLKVRKVMDTGFVLLAIYAFVAVIGVVYYSTNPNQWKLTVFPFILIFVVALLSMRPFFKYRTNAITDKIIVKKPNLLKWYCYVFIICTLISLFFSSVQIIEAITNGNWHELYDAHWDKDFHMWNNQLDRIAKWVTGLSDTLATLAFFYFLTLKDKKNKGLIIVLTLSIFINIFITALLNGTRGTMVVSLVKVFFCYLLFQKHFSKSVKKYITFVAVGILVISQIFSSAVTESRFVDSTFTNNPFLLYFGESMLVFNYGLFDSIKNFLYGRFLLGNYFGAVDTIAGTHFNPHFITFVGSWYLDFGFLGTILLAILLPMLFFAGWKRKTKLDLADMFLYLYWAQFLFQGVFVIGRGWFFSILLTMILYVTAKIFKI